MQMGQEINCTGRVMQQHKTDYLVRIVKDTFTNYTKTTEVLGTEYTHPQHCHTQSRPISTWNTHHCHTIGLQHHTQHTHNTHTHAHTHVYTYTVLHTQHMCTHQCIYVHSVAHAARAHHSTRMHTLLSSNS